MSPPLPALYKSLLDTFLSKKKKHLQSLNRLKSKKPKGLDIKIQSLHTEAFQLIDCMQCANCCRTLGPRLTLRDIQRMAQYLKMKTNTFITTFITMDEDGDYVFQRMPCPFLTDNNYCIVYDYRPQACAEYPHTHQSGQLKILNLTYKNASICPAVAYILEKMEE